MSRLLGGCQSCFVLPHMLSRRSDGNVWVAASGTPIHDGDRPSSAEGERRLLIAVLVHALRGLMADASRPGRGAARRLRQDLRWLTSSDSADVFAFERICEALALDAARIRERILEDLGVCTTMMLADPPARSRRRRPVEPDPFVPQALAV